jgi:hypothetical protein
LSVRCLRPRRQGLPPPLRCSRVLPSDAASMRVRQRLSKVARYRVANRHPRVQPNAAFIDRDAHATVKPVVRVLDRQSPVRAKHDITSRTSKAQVCACACSCHPRKDVPRGPIPPGKADIPPGFEQHQLSLTTSRRRLISIEDARAKPIGLGGGGEIFHF